MFAQLRNTSKKDVVVLRDSNVCVYRNSSGNINIRFDSIHIVGVENLAIGNFDNSDKLEDVIIFYNDSIRIYLSNGDGTLDRSYYSVISYSNTISKIISRQLTLENQPLRTINQNNESSDRDEIVFSSGSNIYSYENSDNNSYTYSQTLSFSQTVGDFEIADVNNDSFNDLLVVGQNESSTSRYMKVFLNNGSGTISTTATFSITSNIIDLCKITSGDFNKDGWNDIVIAGRDSVYVFENIQGSNLFSTSNIVKHFYSAPTVALPKKLIVADLTNQGGLSVLISGENQYLYEDDGYTENIVRINPSVKNTNPAPAYLFRSVSIDSGIHRPRLLMFSRGDRDFLKYKIYKKNWVTYYYYLHDSTTSNSYIDYSETLDTTSYPETAPP